VIILKVFKHCSVIRISLEVLVSLFILALCCTLNAVASKGIADVKVRSFGYSADGTPVKLYTLSNQQGVEVSITNYGGAVVSLIVPDRAGHLADVVLGFDDVTGYERHDSYFGALIGRYGNRIGQAQFKLNGAIYQLAKNNDQNSLHGGVKGFDKRIWNAHPVIGKDSASLELTYISRDKEEGFPGTLTVCVAYTLTNKNELKIDYTATTDADTVVNLTNHSYFNLAGEGSKDISQHRVTIYADRFTPIDSGLIPTGELRAVKGTPFDFTKSSAIGEHIGDNDEQLLFGNGYDHNWVLNKVNVNGGISKAAEVYEPTSGRVMEVWTTEPGLQFYSGNFLDGKTRGKGGKVYLHRSAFCMETQHFPDSPNKPDFPTTVLKPSSKYHTTTVYKFSVR
jgi:aldose 1-epimerase